MSASEPAVSSSAARLNAYASTTHCRSENWVWRSAAMAGSATFTIVMSSRSMNVAVQTAKSVQRWREVIGGTVARTVRTLDEIVTSAVRAASRARERSAVRPPP